MRPSRADLLQRFHRRADRHVRVRPVDEIDVDVVRLQALQRPFQRLHSFVRIEVVRGRFGRDHRLLAPPSERLAEHFLGMAPSVGLGRVDEGYAEIERAMNNADRFDVVRRAPERARHAPRPKPDL